VGYYPTLKRGVNLNKKYYLEWNSFCSELSQIVSEMHRHINNTNIFLWCSQQNRDLKPSIRCWIFLSENFKKKEIFTFDYFLGVYEHIKNRASLSSSYPYFDASGERNVTAFLGQVTHLHCTVRDLGDRTVS
jgi:hypothetical protein